MVRPRPSYEDLIGQDRLPGWIESSDDRLVRLPKGGRASMRPSALRTLAGTFVAEIGVGIAHTAEPAPAREVPAGVAELNRRVKQAFDPTGRMNPGRQVAA